MNEQATKHTPGPWEVIDCAQQHNTDALHRYLIMQPDGNNTFIAKTIKEYDSVDDLANARLIAAAPYLLKTAIEALQIWDDLYSGMCQEEGDEGEREVFGALRSAIREAQGEG